MRRNGIRRVLEQMAGGRQAVSDMDDHERSDMRATAEELYDAGASFESAFKAEKIRRDGFLYVIAHPRMDGVKIGRAFNPESRLSGYQTGCPNREYYLAYVGEYFEDCVTQEKRVHHLLHNVRLQGEWFDCPVEFAQDAIDSQSPFKAVS